MHKKANIYIFFNFFFPQKVEKIGCHSCFNPECNTERGFKESLYITLGYKPLAALSCIYTARVVILIEFHDICYNNFIFWLYVFGMLSDGLGNAQVKVWVSNTMYRMCAIITCGLYTFYPIFKGQKQLFKELLS